MTKKSFRCEWVIVWQPWRPRGSTWFLNFKDWFIHHREHLIYEKNLIHYKDQVNMWKLGLSCSHFSLDGLFNLNIDFNNRAAFFFHHSHISPQNPDNLLCNCLSALLWVLVSFWLDTYRIFMAIHQHCPVLRWTKHKHLQMWATEARIQNDAGYDTIIVWQQHWKKDKHRLWPKKL